MPPVQCPACGRFLKNTFVGALDDAPAACPGCGTELRPEMFDTGGEGGEEAARSPTQRAEDELHGRAGASHEATAAAVGDGALDAGSSVRPPDLVPEEVRDQPGDVLSGWDPGVGPDLDARSLARPPFPTDAVVVAGAGLAGLLVGGAVLRERRGVGAASGAAAGVLAAAFVRRIWRLDA